MPDLSLHKQAQRLRIYIGESDRWRGKSLEGAIIDTLRAQGMAGATVFRGVAGFGAHSRLRTAAIEVLSLDLPVVIEAIDTPERMAAALEILYPMVREGLITLEEVQIVKYTHRLHNPLPADRLVSEVMTPDVVAIAADTPLDQAWGQMLARNIKALPVVDRDGQVVGMLTNEDLLERAGIQQRLSVALRLEQADVEREMRVLRESGQTVAGVMTRPVTTALDSETLGVITTRMVKAGLKRVPVVDQRGRLVGMLSRLDILRQVARAQPATAEGDSLPVRGARLVAEIMNKKIPMVHQDEDLAAVIEKFALHDSHRLVVVDAQGRAVGLISDSDVVARVQPEKRRSILAALRQIGKTAEGKETAFDLMSPRPLTAPPDLPLVEAIRKMLDAGRKWLVVVDTDGKPLGLVDRQILLEAAAIYSAGGPEA